MYFRTQAKIDLDAIEYNFNNIRQKVSPECKLLAVVKADAYGHGSLEITKFLDDKCDFFGIATVGEAVKLKKAGIKSPMLILGHVMPNEYSLVVEYDIRVPVFSLDDAKALSTEAVRQGKNVAFHFCVDTGMSRIGFQVTEECADICSEICKLPNIYAEGIFSHFATADEVDLTKALTQRAYFKSFVSMLENRGIDIPIKHLNNSAGIMNFDQYFDMCRMGIILYGVYPSEDVDKSLLDIKPALSWTTHISYIKTLEAGREISYGGIYKTTDKTVVATVPIGYADGYPRCLSNMGKVLVAGKYARILGRVCMDQFMIDITDIDGVKLGDEVVLIGTQGENTLSVEDVADNAHSFNYELLCRISPRVPRTYYKNGEMVAVSGYME